MTGVNVIDQLSRVPISPAASSHTLKIQVPSALREFKTAKLPSGVYVPVNGATPAVIAEVPVALITVFV